MPANYVDALHDDGHYYRAQVWHWCRTDWLALRRHPLDRRRCDLRARLWADELRPAAHPRMTRPWLSPREGGPPPSAVALRSVPPRSAVQMAVPLVNKHTSLAHEYAVELQ